MGSCFQFTFKLRTEDTEPTYLSFEMQATNLEEIKVQEKDNEWNKLPLTRLENISQNVLNQINSVIRGVSSHNMAEQISAPNKRKILKG